MGHAIDTALQWLTSARAAILTGALCILICLPLGYCHGQRVERAKHATERAAANVWVIERDSAAKERATTERVADTAVIANRAKEQIDAIRGETDADIRRSAACQRLRAARGDQAAVAAGC